MTARIILLRHGESAWNHANFFCGWIDVGLSDRGHVEATHAGKLLAEHDIAPDVVHTSVLRRTIVTANVVLDQIDRLWIPVHRSWQLNERHYGALQGRNKSDVLGEYGEERFTSWRRSFDVRPPAIDDATAAAQMTDPRYRGVQVPRTECLRDVRARLLPYWRDVIEPQLDAKLTVFVSAHGSVIRAARMMIDHIDPVDIVGLNVPTGVPYVYDYAASRYHHGRYLDPDAAAEGIIRVARQGRETLPR